ncbi:oligosaccharide repeat unit polymerase [Nocardioides yefusunii]|uniref:Oligosaccharide repeat unit polymerase n=1 Tax=Nocardioides yefusunii TaxID=2500546 RepID=A0ABW1QWZ0_9ACTN|nr:O-antigen polysaccharide polymerase Wzy [Nocardioides yefusunii]
MWAAAVFAGVAVLIGIGRSRRLEGAFDPMHPLVFPVIYVAVATLAPVMWIYGRERDLGYLNRTVISEQTPLLMALAVAGFTMGALMQFRRPVPPQIARDGATLALTGRLVFLLPLALAAYGFVTNSVLTRGEGQGQRSLMDSLDAAGFMFAPAAVLLIAAGRSQCKRLFVGVDWLGIVTLVTLLGLNGRRGSAIAIILVVIGVLVRKKNAKSRLLPVIMGMGVLIWFAYSVVVYRSEATGGEHELSGLETLLRDTGSVAFTTGVTVGFEERLGGSTIVAGVLRQAPSPIVNLFLGPPDDTGAMEFRRLFRVDANNGYGYSIPADGVLNFGTVGAFLLPFFFGLFAAWAYSRSDLNASYSRQLVYFVFVATLPFAWRSDTLGSIKGVLYPSILVFLALVMARTFYSYKHPRQQESVHRRPVRVR